MHRLTSRSGAAVAALALLAALCVATPTRAQGWGTVKGKVTWSGGAVPTNEKVVVTTDKDHCEKKGPIYRNALVVDPKSKGVRWVLLWITDPADGNNVAFKPAIHPLLKTMKASVSIDQPCCVFEPRITVLREGQKLLAKNTAPVPHNLSISSPAGKGPELNKLIPPNGSLEVGGFMVNRIPTSFSCTIHTWMKGWIFTLPHPYFAVTDENGNFEIKRVPAGKFRLMAWHEAVGFVIAKSPKDRGQVIEVKDAETTDVGAIPFTVPKD